MNRNSLNRLPGLVLGLALAVTIGAEASTINDNVYSKKQAKIGAALYKTNCIACHDKKYFRPVLKAWDGQSLGVLFSVMSAAMPEGDPGSLPLKDYADILAYILSLSRYPAGENALDHENGALDEITIAKKQ